MNLILNMCLCIFPIILRCNCTSASIFGTIHRSERNDENATKNETPSSSNSISFEKYPYLVLATLVENGTIADRSYKSLIGFLVTMEWFLTSRWAIKRNYYHVWGDMERENATCRKFRLLSGEDTQGPIEKTGAVDRKLGDWIQYDPNDLDYDDYDQDEIILAHFTPPLTPSAKVKPIKLPPSLAFSHHCRDVDIVDWTYTNESLKDYVIKPIVRKARVVHCRYKKKHQASSVEIQPNHFCVRLLDRDERICEHTDHGLPIFCNENVLIGMLQDRMSSDFLEHCSREGYATNMSHYMTWLHNKTGVAVPFKSLPFYGIPTTREPYSDPWGKYSPHVFTDRPTENMNGATSTKLSATCVLFWAMLYVL